MHISYLYCKGSFIFILLLFKMTMIWKWSTSFFAMDFAADLQQNLPYALQRVKSAVKICEKSAELSWCGFENLQHALNFVKFKNKKTIQLYYTVNCGWLHSPQEKWSQNVIIGVISEKLWKKKVRHNTVHGIFFLVVCSHNGFSWRGLYKCSGRFHHVSWRRLAPFFNRPNLRFKIHSGSASKKWHVTFLHCRF